MLYSFAFTHRSVVFALLTSPVWTSRCILTERNTEKLENQTANTFLGQLHYFVRLVTPYIASLCKAFQQRYYFSEIFSLDCSKVLQFIWFCCVLVQAQKFQEAAMFEIHVTFSVSDYKIWRPLTYLSFKSHAYILFLFLWFIIQGTAIEIFFHPNLMASFHEEERRPSTLMKDLVFKGWIIFNKS